MIELKSVKRWIYIVFLFFPALVNANHLVQDTLHGYVFGNDTMFVQILPELTVVPHVRTHFKNNRERKYYGRLLRDVKKTLPYAKLAGELLVQVNDSLQNIPTKKAQNQYLKAVEEELFSEYEPVLRKMTRRQGMVLIKLIDRECQITSYEVVKIYRGGFSAFFWQGIARIFGSDLKSTYDPYGEDFLIEEVVLLVEAGVV